MATLFDIPENRILFHYKADYECFEAQKINWIYRMTKYTGFNGLIL
jgi:hypothetical protein